MRKFITLATALLLCTASQAATFGVHTVSKHATDTFNRLDSGGVVLDTVKINNTNPGVYYVADNGATAGVYRNSYYHTTFYAGWTFYGPSIGPVGTGLTAVLATGYHRNPGVGKLRPMLMPSVSLELPADFRVRYMVTPARKGFFQHVTVERSF